MKVKLLICLLLFSSIYLYATTYTVNIDGSADSTSIQAAINASATADTVLVYPGRYFENIDFIGKDIVVTSRYIEDGDNSYINSTIIDGNRNGSVVTFANHETNAAQLIGFTIENGSGTDFSPFSNHGGGILVDWSSPSLKSLIIQYNKAKYCGGLFISSSNANLETVTIRNNHSYYVGGGLGICRRSASDPIDSYVTFSAYNRCNIYNNTSGYGNDIFIAENHSTITNIYLDTLSVLNPNLDYVSQYPNLNLDVHNGWLEQHQVDADLYVDPDGDDNNSGLSPNDPLKTITWALQKSVSDSLDPNSIFLANGVYSPATNGETFPLNLRSSVPIIGTDMYNTILREPEYKCGFIIGEEDRYVVLQNFKLKDQITENNIKNTIRLIGEKINIKNLSIENIELKETIGINCSGSIYLDNVEIKNCKGWNSIFVWIDPGFPVAETVINDAKIINNHRLEAVHGGGGINVYNMQNVYFTNSLIANNSSYDSIWPKANISLLKNRNVEFHNNTIANNGSNGGVISLGDGVADETNTPCTINMSNNIFYNNSSPYMFLTNNGEVETNVNISHTILPGGTDPAILHMASGETGQVNFIFGEGVIDANPLFVGGDENDLLSYYPSAQSPVLDAGTPDTLGMNLPEFDLLGNQRIYDADNDGEAIIDLGCYEYLPNPAPVNLVIDEATATLFWQIVPQSYPDSYNLYLDGVYYACLEEFVYQFTFPELNEGEIYTAGISINYEGVESDISEIEFTYSPLGSEDEIEVVPVLLRNYPNPFTINNGRGGIATTIEFSLPDELTKLNQTELTIYNIKGQKIKSFSFGMDEYYKIRSAVTWDGKNSNGKVVSSGIYLYCLTVENRIIKSSKMMLLK